MGAVLTLFEIKLANRSRSSGTEATNGEAILIVGFFWSRETEVEELLVVVVGGLDCVVG